MSEKDLRYYVRDEIVPFEEDATHEFKGHLNLCKEEIHPGLVIKGTDKSSRAPISKALNAMLNTGEGGTVYLGILDDGQVKGISQTLYQQDHLEVALEDLFRRYTPPVEAHRYKVSFVPLVEPGVSEDEKLKVITFDQGKNCDQKKRTAGHLLRTHRYCWCHKDAQSRFNMGLIAPSYVVEIEIKPWDPSEPLNENAVGEMKFHPIHQDEQGRAYFRRLSNSVEYTIKEIYDLSQKMVDEKYASEIDRLKKERKRLRSLIDNK